MNSTSLKVDARNMPCPLPLLKLKQALNNIELGGVIHLVATDATSKRDFVSYIELTEHQLEFEQFGSEIHFKVIKG